MDNIPMQPREQPVTAATDLGVGAIEMVRVMREAAQYIVDTDSTFIRESIGISSSPAVKEWAEGILTLPEL